MFTSLSKYLALQDLYFFMQRSTESGQGILPGFLDMCVEFIQGAYDGVQEKG